MDRTLFTNVTILDCTGAAPYAGEALVAESAGDPVDCAWRYRYSFTACQTLFTPSPVTSPGFLSLT